LLILVNTRGRDAAVDNLAEKAIHNQTSIGGYFEKNSGFCPLVHGSYRVANFARFWAEG
jgi:hypothetical protein